MPLTAFTLHTKNPDATAELARNIAPILRPADVLLMHGDIGAGKTHFARNLIQELLPVPEDVPSPTFTLVQVYDGPDCEIWHADLYRLSSPDEAIELGLDEAFTTAICIVEWPDRMQDELPDNALILRFETSADPDHRSITFQWTDPSWGTRLEGCIHD